MSSSSYSRNCYFCGGDNTAEINEDNKPPTLDFTCTECGMYSITDWKKMDLEELNQYREDFDLEPLEKAREVTNAY